MRALIIPVLLGLLAACGADSDGNDKGRGDDDDDDTTEVGDDDDDTTSGDDDDDTTFGDDDDDDHIVEERFLADANDAVDVLVVVDNSASMGPVQIALAEGFPTIMSAFTGSGIDFHIGVTSTDIATPGSSCSFGPALQGELSRHQGHQWVDDQSADPTHLFTQLAILGTTGSGCEAGIGAAWMALVDKVNGVNAGFRRDDADLHVVIVSDEDDQTEDSVVTVPDFADWMQQLPVEVGFHSVVCTSAVRGGFNDPCGVSQLVGNRYLRVTDLVGGTAVPIEEGLDVSVWGPLADALLPQVPTDYPLEQPADPGTLSVAIVTGSDAEIDLSGEYLYDEGTYTVTLTGRLPAPGEEVVITYAPLGI